MSDRVFINYRQRDAGGVVLPHALLVEAIADRLATHLGRDAVYLDTTLPRGVPYPEALRARVADAAVLLVVIHPGWLADLRARAGSTDWVHDEIAAAIAAGTRLMPVLLDGTELPKPDQLPETVRALADQQAITLRFGSFAAGIAEATAEIELIVAPEVPAPVTPVAPLPDRSRVVAVLLLFLVGCVLNAVAAVTGKVPFPELPAALGIAVIAVVPLGYLVLILLISASFYAIRRPMAWVDERLVRTPNRAHVVFGLGVVVVSMFLVALMAVAGTGLSVEALMITMVVAVGVLIMMGLLWLRNQERTPDWPHAPASPTPAWVQKALVDLEQRLNDWRAPLPLRHQREALVALSAIRGALATMAAPSAGTLPAWWRTRSPWVTLPHSALAGAAVAISTTALVLHWTAEGPDPVSTLSWLGAVLLATGAYWASLRFEHRRERWRVTTLAGTVPDRLTALEERLAGLSRPGLIAAHHITASAG